VEKLLLKMSEAAEVLGIGLTKTYELVNSGQLRVVRIGRITRVPRDALFELVDHLGKDTEK
jgi:excisionase family DNA binding protein